MTRDLLPCVEIEPTGDTDATCSVIWLHGLGADGHDFEPIVPEFGLPAELGVRFVFPHAPRIPVTINGGMVMPAWYDIRDLDLEPDGKSRHDEDGIRSSAEHVCDLITRENERGIPTDRIVLAGFSQGGAIALHVALRHPERLAGVVALSCYLVSEKSLEAEASPENSALPVFQAHGEMDPMVPLGRGVAARDRLIELGHDVQWRSYPMQHQVCLEEIQDLARWLAGRLGTAPGRTN